MRMFLRPLWTTVISCRGWLCSVYDLEHWSLSATAIYSYWRTAFLVFSCSGWLTSIFTDLLVDVNCDVQLRVVVALLHTLIRRHNNFSSTLYPIQMKCFLDLVGACLIVDLVYAVTCELNFAANTLFIKFMFFVSFCLYAWSVPNLLVMLS